VLFLRQFLGKLLIGLGIYAFIIISGVYSIDIFLNDVAIHSLDALIASLITFGLIVLGKFIYPKLTSSKSSQVQESRAVSQFNILKLTYVGWLFLYSCIVLHAILVSVLTQILPEVMHEYKKLIWIFVLLVIAIYVYLMRKLLKVKGLKTISK